jgi:hypothetical protein
MNIMTNIRQSFTLVGLLIALTCPGFSQDARQFKRGVITVTGNRATPLKGVPGTLLTVRGSRRVSRTKLTRVSVYHALIFYPERRIIGGGGGFSNDGPLSTATVTWTIQRNPPDDYKDTEERELRIRYHALDKSVSVGPGTFRLPEGNLFIIRLDESWIPAATQLRARLDEPAEGQKVLDLFKSALRGDESIQKLELQQ